MSLYLIGDLQGCDAPLERLLQKIDFSASRDTLYALGDLVNRGPDSLKVLRRLSGLGDAAQCLLGNHDLHLLAVSQGVRPPGHKDTLHDLLQAPDSEALLDWLRHRSLALHRHGWLMVHAGVLPQWDVSQVMALASEVERALRSTNFQEFLNTMYGNTPNRWNDSLQGADRLRVIVNALTRLRFCTPDGAMEFTSSESAGGGPTGYLPWFEVPGRRTLNQPLAFGHWSTLVTESEGAITLRHNALPLDTGCVWGGCLTAARLGATPGEFELVEVHCAQALQPGSSARKTTG